jgi:hypothetical protein
VWTASWRADWLSKTRAIQWTATELGLADPKRVGGRLALLYDGAVVGGSMDRNRGAVADARAMAEDLLDDVQSGAKRATAKAASTRRK